MKNGMLVGRQDITAKEMLGYEILVPREEKNV